MPRLLVTTEHAALDEILDEVSVRIAEARVDVLKLLDEADQRVTDARRTVGRAHTGWVGGALVEIDLARSAVDDVRGLLGRVRTSVGEVDKLVLVIERYLRRIYGSLGRYTGRQRKGKGCSPPQWRSVQPAPSVSDPDNDKEVAA